MLNRLISSLTLFLMISAANAGVINFVVDVGSMPTNYDVLVDAPQFDDMAGTRMLDSVTLTIDGDVSGFAKAESLDAVSQPIELILSAELTLSDTFNRTVVIATPSVTNLFRATAFDGIIDFGGTSGVTYDDLFANERMSQSFTSADTLAYFSGSGLANLVLNARATSLAIASTGLITNFETNAAARIIIEYRYTDPLPTPTPSSAALFILGLLSFGCYRKLIN